jgi:hypothetical protein
MNYVVVKLCTDIHDEPVRYYRDVLQIAIRRSKHDKIRGIVPRPTGIYMSLGYQLEYVS